MTRSDRAGFAALLYFLIAAVMYLAGGVVAWLAIVPLTFGCLGYFVAIKYRRQDHD